LPTCIKFELKIFMRKTNYILRSLLFVPGNDEKMMLKAARTNADAIILDLEDSVLDNLKTKARILIKTKVAAGIFAEFQVFVRTNDRNSGFAESEINELTISGIDGFIFPKSLNEQDISYLEKLLTAAEFKKNIPRNTFKIIPLIETTEAIFSLPAICRASKRIIAVAFGSEDFLCDLQGTHDERNIALTVPRAMIAMAARSVGIIPIDTLHPDVHNLDDLEKNLKISRSLGFEGMLCLHPKEIRLAHKYFSPSEREYSRAMELLELNEEAKKQNKKVAVIKGKFIGPPMIKTALKTIERYEAIKIFEERKTQKLN